MSIFVKTLSAFVEAVRETVDAKPADRERAIPNAQLWAPGTGAVSDQAATPVAPTEKPAEAKVEAKSVENNEKAQVPAKAPSSIGEQMLAEQKRHHATISRQMKVQNAILVVIVLCLIW